MTTGWLRTWFVLGRVSNLPTVWTNCLAGWMLAGGEWSAGLAWLAASVSLLYTGGMFLNDACDAAFDREHNPDRPIPSGAASRQAVASGGAGMLAAGFLVMVMASPQAWLPASLLVAAIVLYDVLHKRWKGSVLLMGACRFLIYPLATAVALGFGGEVVGWVQAWSPVLSKLGTEWRLAGELGYLAGAGMFFYIVGITLAARGESTGGGVSWFARALLAAPLMAWGLMEVTWASAIFALLFAVWVLRSSMFLARDEPGRVGKFVAALLAGIVLADALFVSVIDGVVPWYCVALLPLTRLLQRYVPAT